jgi:Ca2+-dependent lipid-binding protein
MSHLAKGTINRRRLNVVVLEAKGLLAADLNGTSDPFVQLRIQNRGKPVRTSTKMKTLAPVWREEFEL